MMMHLADLSDTDLLVRLHDLVQASNVTTAALVAHIGEVDARQLYADEACASMHVYCTSVLGLSDGAAFKRIRAARAARRFPLLLELLTEGRLHLSGIAVMSKHLDADNVAELTEACCGKSRREIDRIVADLKPKPDVRPGIRKLPQPKAGHAASPGTGEHTDDPSVALGAAAAEDGSSAADEASVSGGTPAAGEPSGSDRSTVPGDSSSRANRARPDGRVHPLGGDRYKVQFTADQALVDKLRLAQDLFSHRVVNDDLAEVIDRALTLLNASLMKERYAALSGDTCERKPATAKGGQAKTMAPGGKASRHIPNDVKREVVARDGLRCAFVGADGRRCQSTRYLEFHHLDPWARTQEHKADRIEMRCRTHNQHAARLDFGADTIDDRIRQRQGQNRKAAMQTPLF